MSRISDDKFIEAVKQNNTIHGVLIQTGVRISGLAYQVFHNKVKRLNLDVSHYTEIPAPKFAGRPIGKEKQRELKAKNERCQMCNIENIWNGKHLSFQIDHINGDRYDHSEENLRVICPNCHSQTDTYGGKNAKNKVPKEYKRCPQCNVEIGDKSKKCKPCNSRSPKPYREKIDWPSDEELYSLIWQYSMKELSKSFGVSDKCITKRCIVRNIERPPAGWWASNKSGSRGT